MKSNPPFPRRHRRARMLNNELRWVSDVDVAEEAGKGEKPQRKRDGKEGEREREGIKRTLGENERTAERRREYISTSKCD